MAVMYSDLSVTAVKLLFMDSETQLSDYLLVKIFRMSIILAYKDITYLIQNTERLKHRELLFFLKSNKKDVDIFSK